MELQNVAWLALIAAEILSGENNLLIRIMQTGISERDLLCLIQRDEFRCADIFLLFF